jgi:non-specific serine/threonine protein kinase
MTASKPSSDARAAVRMFGRLQLLRLLGKSARAMAWLAAERDGAERMLVLPRVQPGDPAALERWQEAVRRAARLAHPQIAPAIEVGVQDGWPYVAHDLRGRATLADRMPRGGLPAAEAAPLLLQALRALAFAHEAGVAHHDLQRWMLVTDDAGNLQLAGLAVALPGEEAAADEAHVSAALRQHRSAAERDLVAFGVLANGLLAGTPPLDEPDVARVVDRLAPWCGTGARELVRLPWSGAHPIPDPLRAIVNRATDRQERQRYRNARTLIGALEGWLRSDGAGGGGALALLADRLRAAGALPSSPGAAERAARLALMDRERTNELAEVVLEDLALSFEMLRSVNTAQVRGAQVSGSGPVLTVRRAIAMLGLDGVRRAALALRPWPGPLDEAGAAQLDALLERVKRAGRVAVALRPAGYDEEVVYLVALLQALGRLVVQYHFADEAQQIRRLMQPAPPAREGEPEEPGMTEEAAAFAVLGADIEALGAAVARWWGLDESVLGMIRRLPVAGPVRMPATDDEWLRLLGSCAHEAVEAAALPAARVLPALQRVLQRYGRALEIGLRELQAALQGVPVHALPPGAATAPMGLTGLTQPAPFDPVPQAAGSLRNAAASRARS